MDVARLRDVHRVDRLVLLVEDAELRWWGAQGLLPALHACGIAVQRHPVVDGWIPADEAGFRMLLRDVRSALATGETVAIAWVGGFGRTGTLVACLLIELGPAAATMELTRTIRPATIGFEPQERFVRIRAASPTLSPAGTEPCRRREWRRSAGCRMKQRSPRERRLLGRMPLCSRRSR